MTLHYEDLHVGQRFTSRAETLDRDRIVAFAAEFDPQPGHLDEEQARGSMFGTLVASGWHTAAVTMRLQLEAMLGRFPGGALGVGVESLKWSKPVRPGDALHVAVDVLEMRPMRSRLDRGLLTLRTTTFNQDEEPVMEMTATVMAPRRGGAASTD